MKKTLLVNYEEKPCYNIEFCQDFKGFADNLAGLYQDLRKPSKICIVSDSKVADLYLENLSSALVPFGAEIFSFIFPNGEASKTLDTVEKLYEHLIKSRFTRSDLLIALGGGVVGDLTGFSAATYLRGIDFIQVPTSLLAQVDSSIGGKTGVDLRFYKNMVGAFYMPKLVYMNFSVFSTLDEAQFSCGMGEVIKYGFIKDPDFLTWLDENSDHILAKENEYLSEMVYRSCDWKRIVVENDPKEKGERALLNFGHTIGHAIEKNSDFKLFHGQCVAIGMVAAAEICVKRGLIKESDLENMKKLLIKYDLPLFASGLNKEAVFEATKSDKKMVGNHIKFVLLDGVGNGIVADDVSDDELRYAIDKVVK